MRSRLWSIAAGLVLLAGTALPATAQEKEAPPERGSVQTAEELAEKCRQMMEKREAMRQEMAAMDAKLQELTKRMNAASGQQKVDATAAVVNQLVAQHQAMHRHMEAMGPEMMKHMSEHMAAGGGAKTSMMECPMMKGTEGASKAPAPSAPAEGGHTEHHPK